MTDKLIEAQRIEWALEESAHLNGEQGGRYVVDALVFNTLYDAAVEHAQRLKLAYVRSNPSQK